MDVRCTNCHAEFEVALPAGATEGTFSCPACQTQNQVRRGQGGGAGALVDTHCSTCGEPMAARPGQAVPVCGDCQGEGDGPSEQGGDPGDWMVRKESGKVYGPFGTEAIHQWIAAEKLQPYEEVAQAGQQWRCCFEHPAFEATFSASAKKKARAHLAARDVANAPPTFFERLDKGRLARGALALALAAGALGGAWYTSTHRLLVLPEPVVEGILAQVESLKDRAQPKAAPPRNIVAEEADGVIAGLVGLFPDTRETSTALRIRAIALLNQGTPSSRNLARMAAEEAVVANPRDALALSALVEVWSAFLAQEGSMNLLQPALRLADRAYQLSPTQSGVLRARARYLTAAGRADEAVGIAEQAIDLAPADALSHLALGQAYLSLKPPKNGKAVVALEEAIRLNPRLPEAHSAMAQTQRALGHFSAAAKSYRQRQRLSPGHAESTYALGTIYESIGEPNEALNFYEQGMRAPGGGHLPSLIRGGILETQARRNPARGKALLQRSVAHAAFPNLPEETRGLVLTELAAAHRALGELLLAQSQAEAALKLNPRDPAAHFNIGMVALGQGRFEDAFAALRLATDAEGDSKGLARLRYFQGMASVAQSKPRVALGELVAAVELDPHLVMARLQLAALYLRQGQQTEAELLMTRLAVLDPHYEDRTFFHTSSYQSGLFDLSQVEPAFRKIAKERYYVADHMANYGMVLYHLGQVPAALQALSRALKTDNLSARAHFYMGVIQLDGGRVPGAVQSLKAAAEISPKTPIYWTYLGEAYLRAGALKESERALERAMQFEISAPSLKLAIGRLLFRQGDREAAHRALMDALSADGDYVAASRELFEYGL